MDDPLLVRGFERLGDLPGDRKSLFERKRAARDALRQRRPLDQLEYEGLHALGLLQTVDPTDVGVVERRQRLGLALESRQASGIRGERRGQHLDRDLPFETSIFR